MAAIRLHNGLMSPKRSVLFETCIRDVVVAKRRVSSSSPKSQIVRRAATGGRKSGFEVNSLKEKRKSYAFDWNGVRRTSSTWQGHARSQQPQKSDAKGVLGLLFGVSAVAALAAPAVKWIQDQTDDLVINVDDDDEHTEVATGKQYWKLWFN